MGNGQWAMGNGQWAIQVSTPAGGLDETCCRAAKLSRKGTHFEVDRDDETCTRTRSVILAHGVQYPRLPLDNLENWKDTGFIAHPPNLMRVASGISH
jgi:thioredoxin reductase